MVEVAIICRRLVVKRTWTMDSLQAPSPNPHKYVAPGPILWNVRATFLHTTHSPRL